MKRFIVIENGIRKLCEVEASDVDQAIQIVKADKGIPLNLLYSNIYEFREVD